MTGTPATDASGPARPPLAFRIGVTGARSLAELPQATRDEIRRQAGEVLEAVRAQAARIAAGREARALYAAGPDGAVRTDLRLLSPLAEGADRLVAEVAVGLGYRLDVALPFPRDAYAADFSGESRAAFDRWLDGGPEGIPDDGPLPYLALDGARGVQETRSYEAVGRLVVRNCDLLIAVWDGQPARGRGGTGDIVRFSARFGPPVWWIDASGAAPPRLVRTAAELRSPDDAPQDADGFAALAALLAERLLPAAKAHHRHRHGLIGQAVGLARHLLHRDEDPYRAYLAETPRPERWPWSLYGRFLRALGGAPRQSADAGPGAGPVPIVDGSAAYWERLYRPADRGSTDYGNRYRSSYIGVFALATLAVLCAIASLVSEAVKPFATTVEGLTLAAILWLVAMNQRRNWHGRWIAYRLLAELCRKQGALAVLGWSLPPSNASRLAAPEAWVGWYFNACRRAAPLPAGAFTPQRLEAAKAYVARVLLAGQAQYHRDRKERSARAAKRLAVLGESLFLVTLVLVLAKLGLLAYEHFSAHPPVVADAHDAHGQTHGGPVHAVIVTLGIAAAVLPALSAALLGVRAYAELELLESQSTRMEAVMREAEADLARIRLDRPLASQDLAAEVFDVAGEMLQDVSGWADLFRVKAVEAG